MGTSMNQRCGRISGAAGAGLLLLALSCGSDSSDDAPGPVCETGKQDACTCPGGAIGTQVCDGTKWGPCECPDGGSAGTGGTGQGGASGSGGGQAGANGGDSGAAGAAGGSSGGTGGAGGVAGTAGVGGAAGYGANGLDPLLVPGDPNGEPCEVSVYVNGLGCGYYRACRFVSPTAGACEDVESPCDFYNECADGHACTTNQDCSLMFVCYASACRKFCELDGPCDNGSDCKFIGHESHGVCAP